jgi:N6-adenosine-specific RNA methylase IME4
MESETETLRRAREIRTARSRRRHAERLTEIKASCSQGDLEWPRDRYAIILADPAWDHEIWGDAGKEKSPEAHYEVMSIEEIRALDVAGLANDVSALFLWTSRQHLPDALDLMRHWGFKYVSNVVWLKPGIGLGRWTRDRHELLLIGVKGDMPPPPLGAAWQSVIEAPKGRHSEKPEIFRQMIDAYFPDLPKIELFARGDAPAGWIFWGNQARNA